MEPENVTPHTAPAAPESEGWRQAVENVNNEVKSFGGYYTAGKGFRMVNSAWVFKEGAEWAKSYFAPLLTEKDAEINRLKELLATPNYNNAKKQNETY